MVKPQLSKLYSLIRSLLSLPKFTALRAFFSTWLKLDLTSLAAAVTIYSTVSGALKDSQGFALKIYWWFTRFFTASISITGNDRLNREILNWLGSQVLTRQDNTNIEELMKDTRILTARTESTRTDAWHSSREETIRDDYHHENRNPINYLPTFGTTWFIHEGNVFLVRRINTNTVFAANTPDDYAAAPEGDEPLVVMVLGRSVMPIKRFFETCRNFADDQRKAFITVRATKSYYGRVSWDTTILRPMRPLATVHFNEAIKDELVADITNYLDSNTRRFYTERGIPYRRGYLLHGPPGTGKTSLSLALASYFGLELYLCHLPTIHEDSELENLFSTLSPRCIVLLEDIDAIGKGRDMPDIPTNEDEDGKDNEESDDDEKSFRARSTRCTLSGLLNVLDGVASQEGRIVLMTSNVAHKLDKALIRPGRIDRMIFLGNISQKSAKFMFLRMYTPDDTDASTLLLKNIEELQELALEFSSHIPDDVFTPAELQGFLLNRQKDPIAAAKDIEKWVQEELAKQEDTKRRAEAAALRAKKRKKMKTMELLALNEVNLARAKDEVKEVLLADVVKTKPEVVKTEPEVVKTESEVIEVAT